MSTRQRSSASVYTEKRVSQWEELMRKFSEAHKEQCKAVSLDIPRAHRSTKYFPTGSQYEGSWDVLGMSGHGEYKFPNGVIYKGDLVDGVFHGKGELQYADDVCVRGKWVNGVITERTLVFGDSVEYAEKDWKYCRMPDRRFAIESKGLMPAGKSYLTADQPTKDIPVGYYDTGDGFYDPDRKTVYKYDDLTGIVRCPGKLEQDWIVANCRKNPFKPLGPCSSLYEEFTEPVVNPEPLPPPAAGKPTLVRAPSVFDEGIDFDKGINFFNIGDPSESSSDGEN